MKELNPIQNLFSDFNKILNFLRLKNKESADSFETSENKINTELWMKAKTQDDTYLTYLPYWTFDAQTFSDYKGEEFDLKEQIVPNVSKSSPKCSSFRF